MGGAFRIRAGLELGEVAVDGELHVHELHVLVRQEEREVRDDPALTGDRRALRLVDLRQQACEAQHVVGHALAPLAAGVGVRQGLVQPGRTSGGGRRYSERDVALLREVQRLSQEEGVNLAGIKRIIELEQVVGDLRQRVADLEDELERTRARLAHVESAGFPRRDLVPSNPQTALVVWRPRRPQS